MTDVLRTLSFPAPAKLLNLNDRLHWAAAGRLKNAWADATAWACIQERTNRRVHTFGTDQLHIYDELPPSTVDITLPIRWKRRVDPHNFMPTCKAIVDALVRVGLWWPDDNSEWVTVLEPTLVIGGDLVCVTARARP